MNNRQIAFEIFRTGVERVKPDRLIGSSVFYSPGNLVIQDQVFDLSEIQNIYVLGAGKASALMAQALESVLGPAINGGHIITKYGHSASLQHIELSEAGHPSPDENGLKSTARIVSLAQKAGRNDLVICLWSGGGSSLLADVPANCTLADLALLNDLLLKSGANIGEINCVRKHLSQVKGGQLAKIASPATIISLILSDVIDDLVDVIASGPTAPDDSTFADAEATLEKYHLTSEVAPSIVKLIHDGVLGNRPETLKKDDFVTNHISNILIGNNQLALQAAKTQAENLGFYSEIVTGSLSGNVVDVAVYLVETALNWRGKKNPGKTCLLFGGEPTVQITGNGKGGRNQHLALLCAKLLRDQTGITILSAGTDGTDGPTNAAGAVVDYQTFQNAQNLNIEIDLYLENCDSYNFFQREGGLIITGPTQTNVMDLIVMLID